MSAPTLTVERLTALLAHDSVVKVAGIDIDGIPRGKVMEKSKFLSAAKHGFGFCSVIFGWDMHDAQYFPELGVSNAKNGYRDLLAKIDLDSMRRIPWERDLPLFLVRFYEEDGKTPICADPRGLLRGVLDGLKAKGWTAMAGAEFEYFQFKETPASVASKNFRDLETLTSGMHGYSMLRTSANQDYFYDILETCTGTPTSLLPSAHGATPSPASPSAQEAAAAGILPGLGVPIEGHHTETGPGVYETALAYCEAGRMADNAVLFKLAAKSVGLKYGIMPTFMAKPHNSLPGCSGHIHFSLRDGEGRNAFALDPAQYPEGRTDAKYADTRNISPLAEQFLAGVLHGLSSIVPMLVPTVNGYKRLVPNFWAPTDVSYGYDDRTSTVRIIAPPSCPPEATRFEVRLPGADMNAPLAFSAILALGTYGIENSLSLPFPPLSILAAAAAAGEKREAEAEVKGTEIDRALPTNLKEATIAMARKGGIARKVLGDAFVDHYAGTRQHEWKLWSEAVTDWETARYFELS